MPSEPGEMKVIGNFTRVIEISLNRLELQPGGCNIEFPFGSFYAHFFSTKRNV
jgi:hypothetical protein